MENHSARILLVEDDNVARIVETKTIQELDCVIDVANNGLEAVKLLHENHYDLIFMDISLPDMDGLKLTEKIRKEETSNKTVPIVALTAHGENMYQNQATWVGMNSFVVKPLTLESCKRIFKKFLSFHDKS